MHINKHFDAVKFAAKLLAIFAVLFAGGMTNKEASAATYAANITTPGLVDITVVNGQANVSTNNIKVESTCPAGYTVSISGPTDNTLYLDGNKSNTDTNKKITPTTGSILGDALGTWGYNMTSSATDATFTALTNTTAAIFTKSAASAAGGDNIPIHYGASATNTHAAGVYTLAESSTGAGDNVITYTLLNDFTCTSYLIQFDANSGTGDMDDQRVAVGETTTLTPNGFTAPTNQEFKGWNTKADGTGTTYTNEQEITDLTEAGETIILYAQWGCPAGNICYDDNGANSPTTMSNQSITASATEASLWASNFQYQGGDYGFAGWNTKADGTGTNYGPNETITDATTVADIKSKGLKLYAKWVPSAGNIQSWNGCSAMSIGDVTALKDQRDNNTYAVAKLADGKCWMIENLRLDNTNSDNATGALAQGYRQSTTYGNFSGLADPESTGFSSDYSANSLYSNDGSNNTINIGTSNYPAYRMPRYNNQNTSSPATNMTAWGNSANTYSIGNWYTWHAAIADTSYYNTSNQVVSDTSICPTGWRLPVGGQNTVTVSRNGDFYKLTTTLAGEEPNNPNSGYAYYNGTPGTNASNKLRSYPNNFIYSGNFGGSSPYNRGSYGSYWSSSVYSNSSSYRLTLGSSSVNPGTSNYGKNRGFSVRCLADVVPSTEPGKITYDDNGANSPTTMGNQTVGSSDTFVNLWASNFQHTGGDYGFAGWNTKADGTGTNYGPNETITDVNVIAGIKANGLKLYAKWVPSAGNIQSWNGCSAMSIGDVTALKDQRDNNTYAVAKLADGKCWMIENLRLDNQYTTGDANKALSQGYASSSTYGDFIGLAESESNISNNIIANSIYYSGTQSGTASINVGSNSLPGIRIPRYNNDNTNSTVLNMTSSDQNVYSYGNYYNFSASTADTAYYPDDTTNNSSLNTSVCPNGWHIPIGGDSNNTTNSEYWGLIVEDLYGNKIPTGGDPSKPLYPEYVDDADAIEVSRLVRKYPNNYIYSGWRYDTGDEDIRDRGSGGSYWSSTLSTDPAGAYHLAFEGTRLSPGDILAAKFTGLVIRCVVSN